MEEDSGCKLLGEVYIPIICKGISVKTKRFDWKDEIFLNVLQKGAVGELSGWCSRRRNITNDDLPVGHDAGEDGGDS